MMKKFSHDFNAPLRNTSMLLIGAGNWGVELTDG
jgi:hypothetical protein